MSFDKLKDKVIEVVDAKQLDGYRLALTFSDGTVQEVDFEPFLRSSQHPQIQQFLNPQKFADFHIEYGDLIWGDYALCFPIADLYENHLFPDHQDNRGAA